MVQILAGVAAESVVATTVMRSVTIGGGREAALVGAHDEVRDTAG